jgi:hypothetical protein
MATTKLYEPLLLATVALTLVVTSVGCGAPDAGSDEVDASYDPGTATGGTNGSTDGADTGGTTGIGATAGTSTGATTGGTATGGVSSGGTNGNTTGATNPTTGGSTTGGTTAGGASTGGTSTGGASTGGASTGGACKTDTGAAFTPLTDYTARDGGFGPALSTRNTGDATLGADKVAVFRPDAAKYGAGGVTHPVIVWGNGSTNTVDIWQSFLARVATYGFVVVAPEQTQVTADHMNAAIDYVLRLANDPAGTDCGKIDTTKIGSTGYSRGGGGAISVGSNARITSTFFFASNGNVKNLKAPWGVIGGDMDAIFDWAAVSGAVMGSTQPAFGAALAGVDHNRVASNAKAQEGYIGWMRWRLIGDMSGHDMFVGSSCKFCSDTAFSGVVKTLTFDSL